jgi:cell wall-associated NlpC family hydrolase
VSRAPRRLLCVLAAIAAVLVVPVAPAHATPSPGSVEDQIDQQWNKLEPIIEQYNNVHNKLIANRKSQVALQKRLTPLEVQVNVAMFQVRGMAADAYKQGSPGAVSAMLMTGNATGLADKLSFLDQYAKHQRAEVKDVAELRDRLAADKQDLDTLTTTLATQDAGLARTKAAIEKKITALQKLRLQAYGAAGADDGPLRTGPCPVTYNNDKGGRAAQKACSLIGKPYIFGSDGPSGYDCSGLTKVAWASVGVHLEHYTKDQWGEGRPVGKGDLRPGDLVFYYPGSLHHVAMYIGGGMVVHAPHTGDQVRMATIDRGPIAGYRRPG